MPTTSRPDASWMPPGGPGMTKGVGCRLHGLENRNQVAPRRPGGATVSTAHHENLVVVASMDEVHAARHGEVRHRCGIPDPGAAVRRATYDNANIALVAAGEAAALGECKQGALRRGGRRDPHERRDAVAGILHARHVVHLRGEEVGCGEARRWCEGEGEEVRQEHRDDLSASERAVRVRPNWLHSEQTQTLGHRHATRTMDTRAHGQK
eukprot:2119655-Prymnesium_polylepis.2